MKKFKDIRKENLPDYGTDAAKQKALTMTPGEKKKRIHGVNEKDKSCSSSSRVRR